MAGSRQSLKNHLIGRTLIVLAVCLGFLHVVLTIANSVFPSNFTATVSPWFDLDNEFNVPTVYSGMLFGCAAYMSILLASYTRKTADFRRWIAIGLLLFYLGFDELLVLHEQLAEPLRNVLQIGNGSFLYHAWVIPALAIALLIGCGAFLLRGVSSMGLLQRKILKCIASLAIGVILLEMIGTQLYFSTIAYKLGPVLVEELFEIGMISYILYQLTASEINRQNLKPRAK